MQVWQEQNPWHVDGGVPAVWARPVERPLAQALWSRLLHDEPRRYQLVLGPRRVGKTTVLYQTVARLLAAGITARRVWWLRLDHPLFLRVRLDELVRAVVKSSRATRGEPAFLFLDELSYAEDWELWLKTFYDEAWPVRVVGSSSSTAALRKGRGESGVGRWEERDLAPCLFTEYLSLCGEPCALPVATSLPETLAACIEANPPLERLAPLRRRFSLTGGFPELLLDQPTAVADETTVLLRSQRTLRDDALERAIYKDIPQVFQIHDPLLLERLLYVLAGQVTGVLSPSSLCAELDGLSQPTFDRYLSYLERAYLVFTLPNYSGNESTIQKRGRKLYFVDGAVRNAALQRGLAPLTDPAEMGLLFENLVAGHLHALSQQSQVRIHYWRDKDAEVDLVYDHPQTPLAFEVGFSRKHNRRWLHAFVEKFPRFRGGAYLVSPESSIPREPAASADGVGSLPLDLLLLAAGSCAEGELRRGLGGEDRASVREERGP
ncbi:MAG: ATP-binding protein [Planctomycetes bacterium]|nr:ATP-binding protein [Planctomycetota bacterium]